jgi:hypothetical protein
MALCATAFTTALVLGPAVAAAAADTTLHVQPTNVKDGNPPASEHPENDCTWYREDTRVGGSAIVYRAGEPGALAAPGGDLGDGAIALTTTLQPTAKAQVMTTCHSAGVAVADIEGLTFHTYLDPSSEPQTAGTPSITPSYQMQIDTNGLDTAGGFTTIVYEPYQDPNATQTVERGVWQEWDAFAGKWWTTRAIDCTGGTPDEPYHRDARAGGPPETSPGEIGTECPGAVVLQIGVNVGSNNPNAITAVDGVTFTTSAGTTTWDFGPK